MVIANKIFQKFFLFLVLVFLFSISGTFSNYLNTAENYEKQGDVSLEVAKNYSSKNDYLNSLAKYVEAITYYTLSYHIYIDKLKDKDNFFRLSDKVLTISLETDEIAYRAIDQTPDKNKKNNILSIRSSNYLNFASTLEKMYSVDYIIANEKYKKISNTLKTNDSILLSIAKYFGKSIDIQLSLNNKPKAEEYFSFLEQYYNTLDNKIKDKYEIRKIVDFYRRKIRDK